MDKGAIMAKGSEVTDKSYKARRVNVASLSDDYLLTTREVSQLTGFLIARLQKDRHHGRGIPFVRRGRWIYYYWRDVKKYVGLNDGHYLKEAEVSRLTGRSPSTLQKDRFYRRGIPFVKHGRQVRYIWEDVQAYMRSRRIDTI